MAGHLASLGCVLKHIIDCTAYSKNESYIARACEERTWLRLASGRYVVREKAWLESLCASDVHKMTCQV